MIDSHTHVYSEDFAEDLEAMLERARTAGIEQMVLPAVDSSSWERLWALCQRYPDFLYPTAGLHPTSVGEDYLRELAYVEERLDSYPIVALGEIGLDYHWDTSYKGQQLEAFATQLRWAHQRGLPVILHIREAFADAFALLRQLALPGLRGVFHSFTGTEEELVEALSFEGFYVGINGVVTFKNSNLRDYINRIPLERLLIETDAPYLAPVPKRGRRNEPSYLPYTASYLADCYGIPEERLVEATTANARELFALPQD